MLTLEKHLKILCVDLTDERPVEEGDSRPSQWDPADPEGGHRDALLTRARKGESTLMQTSNFKLQFLFKCLSRGF